MLAPQKRIAVVVSHPIQHFTPFYRAIAEQDGLDLKVFFCSNIGVVPYWDAGMGVTVKWAGNLTDGYAHEFLPEALAIATTSFWDVNNPAIATALRRYAPDVVVICGYSQITALRALVWCRLCGVPAVMISDSEMKTPRRWWLRFLRALVLPVLWRQFSAFLTAGDENERALSRYGVSRSRMFRSPLTINEPMYREAHRNKAKARANVREELGIAPESFVYLVVGKLLSRKRPMDVVEAFLRYVQRAPEAGIALLLCGDGVQRGEIERRLSGVERQVRMAGFVNVDRLPLYYAASDSLIHSAESDPHPLVCSEAAAMGLPMILSDRIGAIGKSDIARENDNAILYPCGDIEALVEAMSRLRGDPALYTRMSSASLEIFDQCCLEASLAGLKRAVREVTTT